MYGRIFDIDETLKAVCAAISDAEITLREHIKLYYPNASEEFITFALYGHIQRKLHEASQNKIIEKAFLKDLKEAFRRQGLNVWNIDRELDRQLIQKASGLVADMVLHNKRQEGKTGGDFGLVIIHPQLIDKTDFLEIKKGASSGLLCQAKLKQSNGRWGTLATQKDVLPDHLDYSSLVLYSYLDNERSNLNSVAWKLCEGHSLSELEGLLKKDALGATTNMSDIITRLGKRRIGTRDRNKIENIISPSVRQHLELRIYWLKDKNPGGTDPVRVARKQISQEQVLVRVRQS